MSATMLLPKGPLRRVAVAAVLSVSLSTSTPSAQSAGPWKTLFNGRDFTGWTILGRAPHERLRRPCRRIPLTGTGESRAVSSRVCLLRPASVAGVLRPSTRSRTSSWSSISCWPRPGRSARHALVRNRRISAKNERARSTAASTCGTGYQLNIGRREAGEYIGVVVHRVGPDAIRGNVAWLSSGDCGSRRGYLEDCDQFPSIRKKGDWNHIRVTFKGPRLQAWLNGTQIVDVTDDPTDPAEASWKEAAPIWFQFPPAGESGGFAGSIKYRNIRAREL